MKLKLCMMPLFIFLAGVRGSGNQVFLDEASLQQLVAASEIIIEVKPLVPFTGTEKIAIKGYNTREKTGRIPDFETGYYNVEIIRVIQNRNNTDLSVKKIKVYPAFTSETLNLHERYYAEGISKSPIYECYNSSIKDERMLQNESSFLMFVTRSWEKEKGKYAFELTFVSSYEKSSLLPEVEKIINKDKQ